MLLLLTSLLLVARADAATITPSTTADELNSDGDCSLREAIQAANINGSVDACPGGSSADTIDLSAHAYTLSIVGSDEDANATGDLDVTGDLTISGTSAATSIIDGGGLDRVIHVINAFTTVEIAAVTIRNGAGGGIFNAGAALALTNVLITSNTGGGTVYTQGGSVHLTDSTVSDNTAPIDGGTVGAIYNSVGSVVVSNSTFTGNTSGEGPITNGGGTMSITDSSFSGNTAAAGSGISNHAGTASVTNVTISDNTARLGGGIYTGTEATTTLTNVTVSGNAGTELGGGGIGNIDGGTVNLKNTILAGNTPSAGGGPDCLGPVVSQGHNLIGTLSGCTVGGDATGNVTGVDPLLGPLSDNGGTTLTRAPLAGSPAIDAGSPDCPPPASDQRGITRPQGAACDIGAVEVSSFLYDFSGFFAPVDNLPTLNAVKAGRAVPVKFSLDGDQGLGIFADGYPKSQQVACDSNAEVDGVESTLTAGSSSLSYDPASDEYTYVWKTLKSWAGTCRQLVVKLDDESAHRANFKFK